MVPIFHLHVPKTGGSTLITLLQMEYSGSFCRVPNWNQFTPSTWQDHWGDAEKIRSCRCISGHYYFDFYKALNTKLAEPVKIRDPKFLAFVRDPVDRLLSLYHYWRTETNRYREALSQLSFEQFVVSDKPGWTFLRNEMTRRFAGSRSGNLNYAVREADFQRALANLRSFPLVGLTDRFDDTIERWANLLDWRHPYYTVRLAQPDRLQQAELSSDLVDRIRTLNAFDVKLVDAIKERDWGKC